jgi:hypothetical protein
LNATAIDVAEVAVEERCMVTVHEMMLMKKQ